MAETTCLCLTTYTMPGKKGIKRTRRTVNRSHTKISKYFPLTTINTLPDEVLLEIFDQYRSVKTGNRPGSQGWWYTLVHIGRRWRRLVFASSIRLNLHLRCTFGTPVEDMIRHSPPFPLVLDYGPHILKKWTAEDELGLLLASQHLPRVSEIVLSAPGSTLANLTTGMTEAAPRLETLSLHSQTSEIVLPKRFLEGGAPQLRHLILTGAALSSLQPLLTSATSLVSLVLERIPSSAYFSPDGLITQIRAMPFLQVLSISFLSTVPRPGFRGERVLPRGQVARIELPGLTQLIYRGVSAYIEALLSRIRSPRIEDVDIALFNQLTLDVPRTCEFVRELESLRPTRARIDLAEASVHIVVSAPHSTASSSPDVFLSVSCARLDFQVAATAQLCSGLSATLLPVEELVLGFHRGGALAEEWRGEVDPGLWRGFLAPFGSVATLRVHVALAVDVERALRPDPTAQPLLPELREIVLLHGSDENTLRSASAVFSAFVDERDGAGHPVKVHFQDLSRLVESETVRAVSSRRILGIV
ncbi:hypothetical protein EDB85DRAFT_1286097 [Lactarius pseudohatsudake]|nr:hypothetical protein EDB85DRAFT_1286097 [Lactarius pseudohatsudake]